MDFFNIVERLTKDGIEIFPDFKIVRTKDLMVRGKGFYAIWDEKAGLWSTDEYDVQRLVDEELDTYAVELEKRSGSIVKVRRMGAFSSNMWKDFRSYLGHLSDSSKQLDETLTFSNTEVKKADHVSKRLPYPLMEGDYGAFDKIIGTLYDPDERAKLEWIIGAIVSGDSKKIQKFGVLYGTGGSGKSTIINIILWLFTGYTATFEAKALTSANNQFSTEAFKSNPLVAIQHDGDLSQIADNSKLNSIISHEPMTINEKYKPGYDAVMLAFLIMATNKPVKITDAKSGIIRRLIDIRPSGRKLPPREYQALMSQISFELGAIAHHCLQVYLSMGKNYYDDYRPVEMMLQTDVFYNFIEENIDLFQDQNGTSLNQAYDLYKLYCQDAKIEYVTPKFRFRDELKNYFHTFDERLVIDGVRLRSWYGGFISDQFKVQIEEDHVYPLVLDETESLFDQRFADATAQYSKANGTPRLYWSDRERIDSKGKEFTPKPSQVVSTVLSDLDTTQEHFVKPPDNHIVIDFDLRDEDGNKSAELNIAAAAQWPPTYGEFSKSGAGIHLHYDYVGDVSELSAIFAEGIEVKVFTGDSSLRRRLSKCNNVPIAAISSGLPLKEKKMITSEQVQSERSLRDLVMRNLRKEIMPGTKPSMDFIRKILDDAYKSDLVYDLTDMRGKLMAFANNSSNQAMYCLKMLPLLKLQSKPLDGETPSDEPDLEGMMSPRAIEKAADSRIAYYDVEVFPNLFIVCWKYENPKDSAFGNAKTSIVRMINPTAAEVEQLFKLKLVGFNNRRYDNHILYGRFMGYSNEQLYKLSKKIIDGVPNSLFANAYDLSYADIYDFSSKKQGLKKWEIELGIPHKELGLPWDEPVPEERWEQVAEYCDNDVHATEATFEACRQDFVARQILAELSGMSINASTLQHTAKIIFKGDRHAQDQFIYTDLSEEFPGYTFERGKSDYRGENPSEGGYVYAEPGIHEDVALLDIQSMHPTTIHILELFGPEYTKNFWEIVLARLAVKRGDYEEASKMLDGKLAPFLKSKDDAQALSYALKIIVNIVYGVTSAKFDNAFRDKRNIDNIVAKRGALFMIELKHAVQEKGFTVAHIKTDSIKIPNATKEIIDFVMEFGDKYGYTFEHEATYEKMALVNDAVYVAKVAPDGKHPKAYWSATGAQFQHPYVFKKLFSKEQIVFRDLCEAKFVTTALYLDFRDDDAPMALVDDDQIHFVGKAGLFTPVRNGGATLVREKDGKFFSATGAKGYKWLESDMVQELGEADDVDMSYFDKLVDGAIETLKKFGDPEQFLD